ncbi:MAG: hypothetical protein A2161_17160 [Candidatus Schekmanbacteria bacterium RBG_13_48_7]|uniref:Uncharacterized protein n=1 Tax=Candidatus Schekmanbacteria bacterium RBG_13_48_7 TaxID=1817878 RepID=A0A1F7S112_9BACT|nr:MAG: hypothetical protein A2161_17160 [Candidatus Schekmanbacteria bacterium RBG_13_48_7]
MPKDSFSKTEDKKDGKNGKNGKDLKTKFLERKNRGEVKEEGKPQKKLVTRDKERGGGSWKRFLKDYETYLEEEDDRGELRQ